ncbi:MAG: hypothetical protein NTY64_12625 [Deltaproteobacteria bacterium]|nr:hypothetical protein [Deltaproteobacteria bacterium]
MKKALIFRIALLIASVAIAIPSAYAREKSLMVVAGGVGGS